MKSMTCKQLGGACDEKFTAETFEEMAALAKIHGALKFQEKEPAHLAAMQAMMAMMQEPGSFEAWFDKKRAEFEALPPL